MDAWLLEVSKELDSCQVDRQCTDLVIRMLAFREEDRCTAEEVLQSAFLMSE